MQAAPLLGSIALGCGSSSGDATSTSSAATGKPRAADSTGPALTSGGPGGSGAANVVGGTGMASAEAGARAGTPTGRRQPELVEVGHGREFRAVWVATVSNIDFPGSQEVDPDGQKAELAGILDATAAAGLNAVVFQVRPEGDALYASAIEPWSRY